MFRLTLSRDPSDLAGIRASDAIFYIRRYIARNPLRTGGNQRRVFGNDKPLKSCRIPGCAFGKAVEPIECRRPFDDPVRIDRENANAACFLCPPQLCLRVA